MLADTVYWIYEYDWWIIIMNYMYTKQSQTMPGNSPCSERRPFREPQPVWEWANPNSSHKGPTPWEIMKLQGWQGTGIVLHKCDFEAKLRCSSLDSCCVWARLKNVIPPALWYNHPRGFVFHQSIPLRGVVMVYQDVVNISGQNIIMIAMKHCSRILGNKS